MSGFVFVAFLSRLDLGDCLKVYLEPLLREAMFNSGVLAWSWLGAFS